MIQGKLYCCCRFGVACYILGVRRDTSTQMIAWPTGNVQFFAGKGDVLPHSRVFYHSCPSTKSEYETSTEARSCCCGSCEYAATSSRGLTEYRTTYAFPTEVQETVPAKRSHSLNWRSFLEAVTIFRPVGIRSSPEINVRRAEGCWTPLL